MLSPIREKGQRDFWAETAPAHRSDFCSRSRCEPCNNDLNDSPQLKVGDNIITLDLKINSSATRHVMYDYVSSELP